MFLNGTIAGLRSTQHLSNDVARNLQVYPSSDWEGAHFLLTSPFLAMHARRNAKGFSTRLSGGSQVGYEPLSPAIVREHCPLIWKPRSETTGSVCRGPLFLFPLSLRRYKQNMECALCALVPRLVGAC